jgi:hypothetical protein
MVTRKGNEHTIVLSWEERKRFATFIELLIVIDKRVNKSAQQKKEKRCSRSCCLSKTKSKKIRLKISPLNAGSSILQFMHYLS